MRNFSPAVRSALRQRLVVARDFIWVVVRHRQTGVQIGYGFWSDLGTITAPVYDPRLGQAVSRVFEGAGGLIKISDIPLTSNLTVQPIRLQLSQIDPTVEQAFRAHDMHQAPIQIYRGFFDPATRNLIEAAGCRFVGFVNVGDVLTPPEGEEGTINLSCVSHTQEMLRENPATRSHEDIRARVASDDFGKDAATVGDWKFYWGKKQGKLDVKAAAKDFLR